MNFCRADFAKGRAAVLFSATLSPAGYYKDLCGVPEARAVALRSPFPAENLGLWCARNISTRYKDRADSVEKIAALLYEMVCARAGELPSVLPQLQLSGAGAGGVLHGSSGGGAPAAGYRHG